MAGVNKVTILGRLGKDPEVKSTQQGTSVVNFTVATSENWKDKNGEKQEKTEWHRIVAFAKLADIIAKYAKKGGQVYIEGKIQTRSWKDKDGQTKYTTEIIAQTFQFVGSKASSGGSQDSSGGHEDSGSDHDDSGSGGGVHLSPDDDGDAPF